MKRLLVGLLLCLTLVPLTLAQATPTPEGIVIPAAPYSSWTGNFTIKPSVAFVWLRTRPDIDADILGTFVPNQALRAFQHPDGISQSYDVAFAQWWGYFEVGAFLGWIELNSVIPVVIATPTPNITDAANWVVTDAETIEVQIASGIPFAWVRNAADSNSGIARTLFPGAHLILTRDAVSDGFQLWWPVQEISSGTVGFVEQKSLRYVRRVPKPDASQNPSTWVSGTTLRVKASVPFVWVRDEAGSSEHIIATILKGREVVVDNGPVSDGVQNWWRVFVANPPFSFGGWIEQSSLESIR